MSREQLEKVAQDHQIKNIKKFTDENLSFAILDAQAAAASLQPIEKPKAKRGRPRKNPLPEQTRTRATKPVASKNDNKKAKEEQDAKTERQNMNAEPKVEHTTTPVPGQDAKPAPKKRGRKPKSASVQPQAEAAVPDIDKKPESVTEKSVSVEETAQMIPDATAPSQSEKPVNGKEFIHALFDDLKDDPAAHADISRRKQKINFKDKMARILTSRSPRISRT